MANTNTIYLPDGYKLALQSDEFSSGKYYYKTQPGEASVYGGLVEVSKSYNVGPFNEGRFYTIYSDTGLIATSLEFSGNYTKEDETEVSDFLARVDNLDDLPAPVNSVITLESNKAYHFTRAIDLEGSRLVGGDNTAILGTSSETSSITSTGLGVGVALFTTTGTTPIQNISFKDVDTALAIDGGGTAAYDWHAFNIVNVPNIGTIENIDNWILTTCAFLNSQGLVFDGTAGTIGINNSLLTGDGSAGNIIEIAATANISRRFRIVYSAIVSFSSSVGINVSTSATIPVEGYILDTINFSGNGTYTSGVSYSDNKAKFIECRGVINSANISSFNMLNNATETTITTIDTPVKVSGTTSEGSLVQRFTHTSNRLTFVGAISREFLVTSTASIVGGNNKVIGLYVAKNGSVLTDSEIYATTNAAGKAESISVQAIVTLEENDYIEMFVENTTDTSNVTVEFLNVIVSALN